jgi:hypothetical protein
MGVPMVTQGGAYIFQLMDFYGASGIPILWCCFFQVFSTWHFIPKILFSQGSVFPDKSVEEFEETFFFGLSTRIFSTPQGPTLLSP